LVEGEYLGHYRGKKKRAEDPDFGELLIFSFKVNDKKVITEASVINQAIKYNTIECVDLKLIN